MPGTGTAIVDFGAVPTSEASLVVAQAGILGTSLVEAWLSPVDTAGVNGHMADDHMTEIIKAYAGAIVAGVSFTIYLRSFERIGAYGKYTVNWVWF